MISSISKIINDFDPLDLIPFAPQDEYCDEIKEIGDFIQSNLNCDVDTLAQQIYKIFLSHLGSNVFTKSIEECRDVAQKILLQI